MQQSGDTSPLLAANTKQAEDRLDELNGRLEGRLRELQKERQLHHQRYSAARFGLGAAPSGPRRRRESPPWSATMRSSALPLMR